MDQGYKRTKEYDCAYSFSNVDLRPAELLQMKGKPAADLGHRVKLKAAVRERNSLALLNRLPRIQLSP
jgi:hypothetical protein